MQEMIKKILEMDEQARRATEDANAMKVQAETSIEQQKINIREEYLARAHRRLQKIEETEQKMAQEEEAENAQKYDSAMKKLNEACDQNFESWVQTVVQKTIGR